VVLGQGARPRGLEQDLVPGNHVLEEELFEIDGVDVEAAVAVDVHQVGGEPAAGVPQLDRGHRDVAVVKQRAVEFGQFDGVEAQAGAAARRVEVRRAVAQGVP